MLLVLVLIIFQIGLLFLKEQIIKGFYEFLELGCKESGEVYKVFKTN